jgi:hypothetical protein
MKDGNNMSDGRQMTAKRLGSVLPAVRRTGLPTTPSDASVARLKGSADTWLAYNPAPEASLESYDAALEVCRAEMAPMGKAEIVEFGRQLDATMALWPSDEAWIDVSQWYFEAFEDVPLDLALSALKQARRDCKWRPRPAELRNFVRADLSERKLRLKRLKMMYRRYLTDLGDVKFLAEHGERQLRAVE